MLINAQRAGQLRVAIVDGTTLQDYQVDIAEGGLCRGNIYRGVVANVQPSLGAAFIDIGEDRHAFLPVADVHPSAYHRQPPEDERRPRIEQVLERGKPILVQVTKDGVGQKGPALNTNIALAGRYLVLTPFDEVRGISRKAEDDDARKKVRARLKKLTLPEGTGVIVRTNGLEQNQTTLSRDLNALLRLWKRVRGEADKGRGPRLLYSDQDLVVQVLRDYLDSSVAQVIVDDDEVHEKARSYMQAFMPRSKTKLIRYGERLPLFSRYRLEQLIDRIYERTAPLPSGGSIVIDGTEALTAIDVNSGRATHNTDHDESIFNVNVEAAAEVARQLRLRDIGGLVVVDFIDMRPRKHQHKLEKVMRDAMKDDKARYTVGRISPNGLMEINRQRIKQALAQRTHRPCPSCLGAGTLPTSEFAATTLLGRIEARVATGLIERATVAVHPEIADALQNHHRDRLAALEQELDLSIEVISSVSFNRSDERIDWQHREKRVVPRSAEPAFTATDIALPADQRTAEEAEAEPAEKAPAKRRRRRRKSAKPAAEQERAAAAAETPADTAPAAAEPEAAAEEAVAEPTKRPRRRRRGGRRRRKANGGTAAGGEAAEAPADTAPADTAPADTAPAGDSAAGWNAEPDVQEVDSTAAKKRPARKTDGTPTRSRRGGNSRRKPKVAAQADAERPEPDVNRVDAAPPPVQVGVTPEGTSPPPRREQLSSSKLRWQWWGGPDDEPAGQSGSRDSPPKAADAED